MSVNLGVLFLGSPSHQPHRHLEDDARRLENGLESSLGPSGTFQNIPMSMGNGPVKDSELTNTSNLRHMPAVSGISSASQQVSN